MPLYSPGRRRAIIMLLLSSVLIITLDMRGNSLLNGARTAWTEALRPFESAAEVVARPVRNAWRGITEYDDVESRLRELEEQLEAQRSNDILARSLLDQYYELRATLGLGSVGDIDTVIATLVGPSPSNLDQTIEIDRGTNHGVADGMPVLSTGGGFLIGRVLRASPTRSTVTLMTDTTFFAEVKIVRPEGEVPIPQFNVVTTTTSTTTTTTTTLPGDSVPPEAEVTTTVPVTQPTAPPATPVVSPPAAEPVDPATGSVPAPTTTVPPPAQRETGELAGHGAGQLLEITSIDDNPGLGAPQVGDIVMTSGGSLSLAPADVPIGMVTEVINTSPADGLTLRVLPFANLDSFEYVQVMLYKPDAETPASD